MTEIFSQTLNELDKITHARDSMVLEWGWVCNEYVSEQQAENADLPAREVLTSALDFLAERYSRYMARTTIAERQRVMGYFTRERHEKLGRIPLYNQYRACVKSLPNSTDIDAVETEKRVAWAIENNWPSPDEIRKRDKREDDAGAVIAKLMRAAEKTIALPDVDPILEKYCRAILNYRCGEDGQWGADDAIAVKLFQEEPA